MENYMEFSGKNWKLNGSGALSALPSLVGIMNSVCSICTRLRGLVRWAAFDNGNAFPFPIEALLQTCGFYKLARGSWNLVYWFQWRRDVKKLAQDGFVVMRKRVGIFDNSLPFPHPFLIRFIFKVNFLLPSSFPSLPNSWISKDWSRSRTFLSADIETAIVSGLFLPSFEICAGWL